MIMHPGIVSWKNLIIYAFNAFSIPLLLKTLFLPWKMDKGAGSKFSFFEKIVFSLFSRIFHPASGSRDKSLAVSGWSDRLRLFILLFYYNRGRT